MILKSINEKLKNKTAAIQFLCKEMDNGIVYMDCTKLLNGEKLHKGATGKGIVYQYRNCDFTQQCRIERSKQNKSFVYTVSIVISVNL